MNQRHGIVQIDQGCQCVFAPLGIEGIEQGGLPRPQQAGQRDGRQNVGKGIVGVTVVNTVGGSQILQFETGQTVVPGRPFNTRWPQGVDSTSGIDQVPATAPGAILPFVGFEEIPIQRVAGNLVIKSEGVVAQ